MKTFTIFLALLLGSVSAFSQDFQINTSKSEIKISGTSTIHDWEVNATQFNGSGNFKIEDGNLISVSDVTLQVSVNSIKSGKSTMDRKIYEALKEKNHKEIIFFGKEIKEIASDKIIIIGDLTVAGVTKLITLEANYELLPDSSLIFTGIYPISMREYNIDAPSAMFGSIKSGNEIKIHFTAEFYSSINS